MTRSTAKNAAMFGGTVTRLAGTYQIFCFQHMGRGLTLDAFVSQSTDDCRQEKRVTIDRCDDRKEVQTQ